MYDALNYDSYMIFYSCKKWLYVLPQAGVAEFLSYHNFLSFRYAFKFVAIKDSVTFASTVDAFSLFVVPV